MQFPQTTAADGRTFLTAMRDRALCCAYREVLRSTAGPLTFEQAVRLAILRPAPTYYVDYTTAMHKLPELRRMDPVQLASLSQGRWLDILDATLRGMAHGSLGLGKSLSRVLAGPAPRFYVSPGTAMRIIRRELYGRRRLRA